MSLLEQLEVAPTIHRDVATVEEFEYYAAKWQEKRYEKYKVLYLAMHGDPGEVALGKDRVSLDRIQEVMRGSCSGR